MREARAWFLDDFNPESLSVLISVVSGERNASLRRLLGYGDMAASLVTTGAIDPDAFQAAHGGCSLRIQQDPPIPGLPSA